jgi:hypothetical protein
LARLRSGNGPAADSLIEPEQREKAAQASSFDFELNWNEECDLQATLHALEPPEVPERMTPGQAAQLCEMLEFLHLRLRNLIESVKVPPDEEQVLLELRQWQAILDLQSRLAEYLRQIGEP